MLTLGVGLSLVLIYVIKPPILQLEYRPVGSLGSLAALSGALIAAVTLSGLEWPRALGEAALRAVREDW